MFAMHWIVFAANRFFSFCLSTGVLAALSELVLVGVHTDPDDAVSEMEALVDVHAAVQRHWRTDNILILGDLNADCSYASGEARERLRLRTCLLYTSDAADE